MGWNDKAEIFEHACDDTLAGKIMTVVLAVIHIGGLLLLLPFFLLFVYVIFFV